MKKVLVTGGNGFIGQFVVPKLINKGYEVITLSRNKCTANNQNYVNLECNIHDINRVERIFKNYKPSFLVHLAWITEPGKFWESKGNLSYVISSLALYRAFAESGGQRVISAGTCAEYMETESACSEKETSLSPNTFYGIAKLSLYQLQSAYFERMAVSSAWGRIFYCYGINENEKRLVPSIIQNCLQGKCIKIKSKNKLIDILYIKDIADAFVHLLESDYQGSINIASGYSISVGDLAIKIARKLNAVNCIEFKTENTGCTEFNNLAETNILNKTVNWIPEYTLEQGLDENIDWWKAKLNY
jgi:nucleoside-diphosphate-sugar epimerase